MQRLYILLNYRIFKADIVLKNLPDMDKETNDYAWKIILWLILFLVFGIVIIT
jgi:hypothetical protein